MNPVMQEVQRYLLIEGNVCCVAVGQVPVAQIIAEGCTTLVAQAGTGRRIAQGCVVGNGLSAEVFAEMERIGDDLLKAKRVHIMLARGDIGDDRIGVFALSEQNIVDEPPERAMSREITT